MGFNHTKSEQARLKIQLVVNVNGGKAKSQIKEPAGADALVVSGTAISAGETITGMRLANGDTEEVEKAAKAGADFVICR